MSEAWTITVRPEGPGPDIALRVRRAIKAMLRQYGLRVTSIGIAGRTGEVLPKGNPGRAKKSSTPFAKYREGRL